MTENCQLWRLLATSSSTHMDVWHNIFFIAVWFRFGFWKTHGFGLERVWFRYYSYLLLT